MTEDLRCCGSGTCLINAEGFCWCGQRWEDEKMCFPDQEDRVENIKPGVTPVAPQPSPSPPNRSS